jgi:hypothetical protein
MLSRDCWSGLGGGGRRRRRKRRKKRECLQPKQQLLRPPQLIRQPYVKKVVEVSSALRVDMGTAHALTVFWQVWAPDWITTPQYKTANKSCESVAIVRDTYASTIEYVFNAKERESRLIRATVLQELSSEFSIFPSYFCKRIKTEGRVIILLCSAPFYVVCRGAEV